MFASMKQITAILLALTVLMTSGAMASARGQMRDASGAMVICTGAGVVTVLVDENGTPIEHGHICPDCALSVLAGLEDGFQLPELVILASHLSELGWVRPTARAQAPETRARAPPVV